MYRPLSHAADSRPLFVDPESQVRNLTQDSVTSFNTGNYDHVGNMFAPDGVFMAPHQEPAYGQKGVERLLRQLGENGYEDLRLQTTRVDLSGDMAMETGRYSVVVRHADRSRSTDHGKYLKVWRRLGAWLVVAECWSSSVPLANANDNDLPLQRQAS